MQTTATAAYSLASLFLCGSLSFAQTPDFQTGANVVLVPAVVRDSAGKSVGGLTREDFILLEDGQTRVITNLEVEQRHRPSPIPKQFDAYVFDDLHLSFQDLEHARAAFERHLDRTALTDRRVAVFTTSKAVFVPFTKSRTDLMEAVRRIRPAAGTRNGSDCPEISYYLADRIAKRDRLALGIVIARVNACTPNIPLSLARQIAETEATRTLRIEGDRTKAALGLLASAINQLQKAPGGRSVVLVSSGFHLGDDKEREGLASILTVASRHDVTISAVNAYGVRWTGVDATVRDAGDWLKTAAEQTGGTYIGNSNNVEAGLNRLTEMPEHTYVLAFRPQSATSPGKFHRLEVRLREDRGRSVQSRRGYYELAPLSPADALRRVLFSKNDVQQLDLTFEVDPTAAGHLRVAARVGAERLSFRSQDGKYHNSLIVAFGLFDTDGKLISDVIRHAEMKLDDGARTTLLQRGLTLTADFTAPQGEHLLRIVVRESETGKITSIGRIVNSN